MKPYSNKASKSGMIQAFRADDSVELPGDKILVLNFTHPLSQQQREQIEALASTSIEEIRTIPVQINLSEPLEPQIIKVIDSVNLSSQEWQTRPLLINPPGYGPAAFVLLAELHGRIGHFPTLLRLRPVQAQLSHRTTATYEVAELINLQTIRETARRRR